MTLAPYKKLISNLPYLDQAFETKEATWRHDIDYCPVFSAYCQKTFITNAIKISRRDVFNNCQNDFVEGLFTTVLWGYSRNMRGKNFNKILSSIQTNKIQPFFPEQKNLSEVEFIKLADNLNNSGLGLSTLSKLLYFFRYKIESYPCLILDNRIIEVLNDKNLFTELSSVVEKENINEYNKVRKYVSYLKVLEEVSIVNNYKPDQLELFLFLMGRNLKAD